MNGRTIATEVVLGARIAYGAGLLLVPGWMTRRWLGPAPSAATRVGLRGLGAREVALHAGALHAVRTGEGLRPWLAASITGDLADVAATTVARDGLPDGSARATLVVAGASAMVTAALALATAG